jgi:DNA-binding NtrC family response regulator
VVSVLVIEDDAVLARTIGRMLRGRYEVCIETSAHAAIARIIETGGTHERFDIVLCDSRMPGATGADVLQIMRKHSPSSIFVLMSGEDTLATADCNLVKPFGFDDFELAVGAGHRPWSSCG